MTDRELLEAAAKAAGYVTTVLEHDGSLRDITGMHPHANVFHAPHWNPLTDDGDALRLAVKLEIDVAFVSHHAPGRTVVFTDGNWSEFCDPDPYAATRRAIVRAAAALALKETP